MIFSANGCPFWSSKKEDLVIGIVIDFVSTQNKKAIVNSDACVMP